MKIPHDREETNVKRMTKRTEHGTYEISGEFLTPGEAGCEGAAAEKLARLEELCETLCRRREECASLLEELRKKGKTNSYRFREAMGNKGFTQQVIGYLKDFGLFPEEEK